MQNRIYQAALAVAALALAAPTGPDPDLKAEMHVATPSGPGEAIGTVTIGGGPDGATFTTDLHGLPPGQHGFHVHTNGDCGPSTDAAGKVTPAGAAGGHWDPGHTGKHLGPHGEGHLGDLPVLEVGQNGDAKETLTAARIKDVAALKGHSLMIHAGGDNYSDQPKPLGGGGARIACGVIE